MTKQVANRATSERIGRALGPKRLAGMVGATGLEPVTSCV